MNEPADANNSATAVGATIVLGTLASVFGSAFGPSLPWGFRVAGATLFGLIAAALCVVTSVRSWRLLYIAVVICSSLMIGYVLSDHVGADQTVDGTTESSERRVTTSSDPTEGTESVLPTEPTLAPTSSSPPPASSNTIAPAEGGSLAIQDGNFIDLDRVADGGFPTASLEGGADYEFRLDFVRLFAVEGEVSDDVRIAIISDTDVSRNACERSTRIQGEVIHLADVGQSDAICVFTSEGRLAVLTIAGPTSDGGMVVDPIEFAVVFV